MLLMFYLQVDIDECNTNPLVKDVRAVPHFKYIKNGVTVFEFSGANPQQLESGFKANI